VSCGGCNPRWRIGRKLGKRSSAANKATFWKRHGVGDGVMKGDLRRRSHSVTGSNRDNKIKDIHTMTLLKTMIVLTVGVMLSSCAGVRTGGGLEPVNTKLNDPGRATYRVVR
jgi:hypothetical protein